MHDTLRGGKDKYFDHLVAVTHAGDKEALAKYAIKYDSSNKKPCSRVSQSWFARLQ